MVDYNHGPQTAVDITTGNVVQSSGLSGHVYATEADAQAETNALTVVIAGGVSTTDIPVSSFGQTAQFVTQYRRVWWRSGTFIVQLISFDGVLEGLDAAAGAVLSVDGNLPDATGNATSDGGGGGGGTTDHGALSGLDGDDHPQYMTAERGDARWMTAGTASSLVANSVAAAEPGNRNRENHFGVQPISSISNLESRLAALEAGGGGGSGILLLAEGAEPPLGTPPGIIGYIPSGVEPELPTVATISYTTEGSTASCAVPAGVEIGDAVVFIAGFDPASTGGDISVSDTGWVEIIDYSANHTRDTAAYVYRVTDSTALAALGATVTANYGQSGRRMGVCFTIPGSRVATAWPAYTSGSNRSAATINTPTTTGCVIQTFATATVPFHKVVAFVMHDADALPAASAGFTEVAHASGSAGGAAARTLTVLIKDLAATPIPAATITHATAGSSTHGGGQFIVPVAP